LAEQVLIMLVGFSDSLLVGHYLDRPHLAAITLMSYLIWVISSLFAVVAIGATAMVARFVGAKNWTMAKRVTHQAILVGLFFSLVSLVLGFYFLDEFPRFLRLQGDSAKLASQYLSYIVPVLPLIGLQVIGVACLRGAGDMVSGLVVMTTVNVVNVTVSWLLVLGVGPFPKLGWEGIAIGTMAGYIVGGIFVLSLLLAGKAGLRLRLKGLWPDLGLVRRLLRIGIPGGFDMLSLVGCQLWFLSVINCMGELATASHGIALRIESLAFLPGAAFAVAATTLVGQNLGAEQPRQAARSGWIACLVGALIMLLAVIFFSTQSEFCAGLLVNRDKTDVIQAVAPLLQIIAIGIPALAPAMILTGGLRGAGDTVWPMMINLFSMTLVRITLTFFLAFESFYVIPLGITIPGLGIGLMGAWIAMVVDLWVRGSLVLARFAHGGWKHVKV
jgi:putative MATE family efflux protein